MKKIIIMALVFSLALVSLSGAAQGTVDDLDGFAVDSYDGEAEFYDGDTYYGTITAVDLQGDNIAINTGVGGGEADGYSLFGWAGDSETYGWDPDPASIGSDIYFIGEHPDGYVWATWRESETATVADPQHSMMGRYEPIPTPEVDAVGPDYISINISSPTYTDFDGTTGETTGQGTFELVESYAVFIQGGEYEDYTYIGDADDFFDGDAPIPAHPDDETDPTTVDTGHFHFNTTDDEDINIEPETEYTIYVRMNIGPEGLAGGYEDVDDHYTTTIGGESTDPIETPSESEFGPGIIVPVIAIVGMFVAMTIYRRRRYD